MSLLKYNSYSSVTEFYIELIIFKLKENIHILLRSLRWSWDINLLLCIRYSDASVKAYYGKSGETAVSDKVVGCYIQWKGVDAVILQRPRQMWYSYYMYKTMLAFNINEI